MSILVPALVFLVLLGIFVYPGIFTFDSGSDSISGYAVSKGVPFNYQSHISGPWANDPDQDIFRINYLIYDILIWLVVVVFFTGIYQFFKRLIVGKK
jgi:hypothetical protein